MIVNSASQPINLHWNIIIPEMSFIRFDSMLMGKIWLNCIEQRRGMILYNSMEDELNS
jgi:hypothetical protein